MIPSLPQRFKDVENDFPAILAHPDFSQGICAEVFCVTAVDRFKRCCVAFFADVNKFRIGMVRIRDSRPKRTAGKKRFTRRCWNMNSSVAPA